MDELRAEYLQRVVKLLPDAKPQQHEQLALYLLLVSQYRRALNLTRFGDDPATMTAELVGETVRLLELGEIAPGSNAIDLGSGVGCPVVLLAVLCPAAHFSAVEVRARRVAFLRTVVAKLSLDNLDVLEMRAETLATENPCAFDLLTSRAFAPVENLLPLAMKLVRNQGEVRGYLGATSGTLADTATASGLTVVSLVSYQQLSSPRHVYLLQV